MFEKCSCVILGLYLDEILCSLAQDDEGSSGVARLSNVRPGALITKLRNQEEIQAV